VTTLAPVSDLPPEWAYKGCYSDMIRNRVLDEGFFASRSNMTGESCINYCGGLGFSYAGTGETSSLSIHLQTLTDPQSSLANVSAV
jgi:hypothetical protein